MAQSHSPFVLVDTNVISYIFKGDSRGEHYFKSFMVNRNWALSFMTLAELDAWAIRYQWAGKRKAALEAFLSSFMIIPYDRKLCLQWADVTEQARRSGKPIQCADAWIAATALLYDLPLVTHNPRDFAGVEALQIHSA